MRTGAPWIIGSFRRREDFIPVAWQARFHHAGSVQHDTCPDLQRAQVEQMRDGRPAAAVIQPGWKGARRQKLRGAFGIGIAPGRIDAPDQGSQGRRMSQEEPHRLALLEGGRRVHAEIREISAENGLEIRRLQQPDGRSAEDRAIELARAQHLGIHEALVDIHQGSLERDAQRICPVRIDQGIEEESAQRKHDRGSAEPSEAIDPAAGSRVAWVWRHHRAALRPTVTKALQLPNQA